MTKQQFQPSGHGISVTSLFLCAFSLALLAAWAKMAHVVGDAGAQQDVYVHMQQKRREAKYP